MAEFPDCAPAKGAAVVGRAVRLFRATDLSDLVAVGQAADELFASAGITLPPDDPVASTGEYDCVLVAGDPLVGFIGAHAADGNVHIAQLSVRPDMGRRGTGTLLLEAMAERAAGAGAPAMTLTTFRDVPWNGPWYARRGFELFPMEQWGEQLREIWARESALRHAGGPRVAMRRPVGAASATSV